MSTGLLLVRADADAERGSGHLVRCLALGQAWRDRGGEAVVLGRCESLELRAALSAEGIELIPLAEEPGHAQDLVCLRELARRLSPSWIAVDGYGFDAAYFGALRFDGWRVLAIDDTLRLSEYPVDVLLNQNATAESLAYVVPTDAVILRGPRFALLRRPFRDALVERGPEPRPLRILVTLGGSDLRGATAPLLVLLRSILEAGAVAGRVVVGPSNTREDEVRAAAAALGASWSVLRSVDDMAAQVAWAGAAISAGGSTVWELLAMGVPAAVLAIAGNQRDNLRSLASKGAVLSLGDFDSWDRPAAAAALRELVGSPETRGALSARGPQLVDARGALRVVDVLERVERERAGK